MAKLSDVQAKFVADRAAREAADKMAADRAAAQRDAQLTRTVATGTAVIAGLAGGKYLAHIVDKRFAASVAAKNKALGGLARSSSAGSPAAAAAAKAAGITRARAPLGLGIAGALIAEAAFTRFVVSPGLADSPHAQAISDAVAQGSTLAAIALVGQQSINRATPTTVLNTKTLTTITPKLNITPRLKSKAGKTMPSQNPKVAQYVAALEKTLGTAQHAGVVGAIETDKSLKAMDVKAIAKQFALSSPKSKAAALKSISSRSRSMQVAAAKKSATGGRIAGALGPVAIITAAAMAYDSTKSQAEASGVSAKAASADALKAAMVAGGSAAVITGGVSAAAKMLASVGGKAARAVPIIAAGAAAYEIGRGAVQGYRQGGVGGAIKGAGTGALDFATVGAYSHFSGQAAKGEQGRLNADQQRQYVDANANYAAMQQAKQADGSAQGWSDQARIAAYISRVANAGGTPDNLPYGGAARVTKKKEPAR